MTKPFLSDIRELRERARKDMEKGAVTEDYGLDLNQVVSVFNQILASEIVCVLRYQRHFYMAKGIHAEPAANEFREHWDEEQEHVGLVAERITQLGGSPDFDPANLTSRSASQYTEGGDLTSMIKEDLIAERVVIMWYAEIIRWLGDKDSVSRRLMEHLLEQEEEHANDLADLLVEIGSEGA